MAYTITSDISRMLLAGQKEIFTDNMKVYPLEYPNYTTRKKSTKETETYDSMGNLKAAERKYEGGPIVYGKVTQAYQTSVTNLTWANGFEVTVEAVKYDLYGVVNDIRAMELARTMRELEEENCVYWLDNIASVNLADGVPLASNSHPLIDSAELNDTLADTGSIADPDVHKAMINMFYKFKNHAGGPMRSRPNKGTTHYVNQLTVEEVYRSINKANEFSNTKNTLPQIKWYYQTYRSSETAFELWDSMYQHILFQVFMATSFGADTDKIYTKNMYMNAVGMYNTGCLPNIGVVHNPGS
jgi:hypothetical protein